MNVLNLLQTIRPMFLSLFLLLSYSINSMQPLNGSSGEELKNVKLKLGAFAFGTLIGPNKIITCKSFGEIQWVAFKNPGKAYQVDHSVRHDIYDIQILILKEDVDQDIAVPIELASENNTHEFLRDGMKQLSFVGSTSGSSQMPSDILNLNIERGVGTLILNGNSLNRILVDESNLGLHILSASTQDQNAQFKYDSYDKGGAVLYKEGESYKLAGVIVTVPNLPDIMQVPDLENVFYFQDIQSIRDWINSVPNIVLQAPVTTWVLPEGENGFREQKKDDLGLKAIGNHGVLIDPYTILTTRDIPKLNSVIFNEKEYEVESQYNLNDKNCQLVFLREPVRGVLPMKRLKGMPDQFVAEEQYQKDYVESTRFKEAFDIKDEEAFSSYKTENKLNFDQNLTLLKMRCNAEGNPSEENLNLVKPAGSSSYIKVYNDRGAVEYQIFGLYDRNSKFILLANEYNNDIDSLILKHSLGIKLPEQDENFSNNSDSDNSETESNDSDAESESDQTGSDREIDEKVKNLSSVGITYAGAAPLHLNPHFVVFDQDIIYTDPTKSYDFIEIAGELYKTSLLNDSDREMKSLLKLNKRLPFIPVERRRDALNEIKSKEIYLLLSDKNNKSTFFTFKLSEGKYIQYEDDNLLTLITKPEIPSDLGWINEPNSPEKMCFIYTKNEKGQYAFIGLGFFKDNIFGIIPFPKFINDSIDKYVLSNALDKIFSQEADSKENNIDKLKKVNLQLETPNDEKMLGLFPKVLSKEDSYHNELIKFIDSKFLLSNGYRNNWNNGIGRARIGNQYDINVTQVIKLNNEVYLHVIDYPIDKVLSIKRVRFNSPSELNNKDFYFTSKKRLRDGVIVSFHLDQIEVEDNRSEIFVSLKDKIQFDQYNLSNLYIKDNKGDFALVGNINVINNFNILSDAGNVEKLPNVQIQWFPNEMNAEIDKLVLEESLGQLLSSEERDRKQQELDDIRREREREEEQKREEERQKQEAELIEKSKNINLNFELVAQIPSNKGSGIIFLDNQTALLDEELFKSRENRTVNNLILIDDKNNFNPFDYGIDNTIKNLKAPLLDVNPIKIAEIQDLNELIGTDLFIFGKKDEVNYAASFKPIYISYNGELDNLNINFNVEDLIIEPGIYRKLNDRYELVGVWSKYIYSDKYNMQFITERISKKIKEFIKAPTVEVAFSKIDEPEYEDEKYILLEKNVLISLDYSYGALKYKGIEYKTIRSLYLDDDLNKKLNLLESPIENKKSVSVYKLNNINDLNSKELFIYGTKDKENYLYSFKIENAENEFLKIEFNDQIKLMHGIYIKDQNEMKLVGFLYKNLRSQSYYKIEYLPNDFQQKIENLKNNNNYYWY